MTERGARKRARPGPGEALEVELEHARWRHFGWIVFGIVAGSLLIWKLGTVGKMLGLIFLTVAAMAAVAFARTLVHAPGRIRVAGEEVILAGGLCRGVEHRFPVADVRHAFFLRRAVPWTKSGPVLIVEVGDRAFAYPRDWFGSESDQRRVARELNQRLGRG